MTQKLLQWISLFIKVFAKVLFGVIEDKYYENRITNYGKDEVPTGKEKVKNERKEEAVQAKPNH